MANKKDSPFIDPRSSLGITKALLIIFIDNILHVRIKI